MNPPLTRHREIFELGIDGPVSSRSRIILRSGYLAELVGDGKDVADRVLRVGKRGMSLQLHLVDITFSP